MAFPLWRMRDRLISGLVLVSSLEPLAQDSLYSQIHSGQLNCKKCRRRYTVKATLYDYGASFISSLLGIQYRRPLLFPTRGLRQTCVSHHQRYGRVCASLTWCQIFLDPLSDRQAAMEATNKPQSSILRSSRHTFSSISPRQAYRRSVRRTEVIGAYWIRLPSCAGAFRQLTSP